MYLVTSVTPIKSKGKLEFISKCTLMGVDRGSVVGIATRYGLDGPGIE